MDDMQARAKVDAARPDQEKGPLVCPRCGEEVEADWMVCAYCNNKMKQDVLGAEAESGARTLTADPRQAAAGEPKAPKVARPVEEGPDVSGVRIALPVAGDEGFARKAAKVARPVEEEAPPPLLKCPGCEMDLEPEWKICPACETPIVR